MSSSRGSSVSGVTAFDINKESDVLALLQTIHRGALDIRVKNDLRDLIFSYRSNPSKALFLQIQESCEAHGMAIAAPARPAQSTPPASAGGGHTVGRARPTPRFVGSSPKKVEATEAPQTASVTKKTAAPTPPASNTPQTTETATESVSPDKPTEPSSESPRPESQETVKETNATENSPKTNVPTQPQVAATPPPDSGAMSERIRQIKREVNQKVGNPINLIDADNAIGREYMDALLHAMKSVNGGTQEDTQQAMQRLEAAFAQVQSMDLSAINRHDEPEPEEVKPQEAVSERKLNVQSRDDNTPPAQSASAAVESAMPPDPAQHTPVQSGENPPVEKELPVSDTPASPEVPVSPPPAPSEALEAEPTPPVHQTPEPHKPEVPSQPDSPQSQEGLHSVAKERTLQQLMQQNRVKQVQDDKKKEEEMRAQTDPLMLPEVTSGLQQLLSEWSLFKSSGLFGMGPSGADHPLYKRLAPLTMAAVIAGRFEGASPQIKQSITDYMNGWRYEEGIVHEHTETFEHYLRRVIKRILDNRSTGPDR